MPRFRRDFARFKGFAYNAVACAGGAVVGSWSTSAARRGKTSGSGASGATSVPQVAPECRKSGARQALKLKLSITIFMPCSCCGRHFAQGEASERRVPMRSLMLVAGLLAATGAVSVSAKAADLDEGPPPDRYGSVYSDPRYAD